MLSIFYNCCLLANGFLQIIQQELDEMKLQYNLLYEKNINLRSQPDTTMHKESKEYRKLQYNLLYEENPDLRSQQVDIMYNKQLKKNRKVATTHYRYPN